MTLPRKYILSLILISLILAVAAYLITKLAGLDIDYISVLFLIAAFSVTSYIIVAIFHRGESRDPQSRVFHTLVSMGLKFLLDLVTALIWFVVAKKNSLIYVIVFFVLYLSITLFSVIYILKQLKNKPL